MLIISFDAVGDKELDTIAGLPNCKMLISQSTLHREISSVFVTNTYPIHASVVTGVLPRDHKLTSNIAPFPSKHPIWRTKEAEIQSKTLWQAAKEKGIETAAVLWPATGESKSIQYNIPEAHPLEKQSQITANMKSGSKILQLKMFLRHGKLMDGLKQPCLDNFATACMADLLREKKLGLALVHLCAYDSLCHDFGKESSQVEEAYESLDRNLGILLEAAGDDEDIIVFSDHSQRDVHTVLTPNDLMLQLGLIGYDGIQYQPIENGAFIECCGGSAFLHAESLPESQIDVLKSAISNSEGFRRFISEEELGDAGIECAFGFAAKDGYCYESYGPGHLATHGYPLDMDNYKVFYLARIKGAQKNNVEYGGSLLEIAPLAAKQLGLELFN
ncbi:MAG: alkaline phosphatase family protein [Eubacteriaceae bacterium]|nr:alkaline phosphatase family protein [Eubacteriaceae bacterium]